MVRRLTQREFCRQLVVSLCHSILVRPAATEHHADNTLKMLHGHHYPEKKRRDCRVCSYRGPGAERHFTNTVLACTQTALLSASFHASGLTILKPLSNYCPLKNADMCNPYHFSYIRIHYCTSTLHPLPQYLSIYYSDTVLSYNRT